MSTDHSPRLATEIGKCDICGRTETDIWLISDGTDSGESDWMCRKCMGVKQPCDHGPQRQTASDAESLAKLFHETYERLAPQFGYETRKASAVPWDQVPEQNKALMIAVCEEIKNWLYPAMQDMGAQHVLITRDDLARLRAENERLTKALESVKLFWDNKSCEYAGPGWCEITVRDEYVDKLRLAANALRGDMK